jgi:hypothetical protein
VSEKTNNRSLSSLTTEETNLPLSDSQIEFAEFLGNLLGKLWLDEWKRQHQDESDKFAVFND